MTTYTIPGVELVYDDVTDEAISFANTTLTLVAPDSATGFTYTYDGAGSTEVTITSGEYSFTAQSGGTTVSMDDSFETEIIELSWGAGNVSYILLFVVSVSGVPTDFVVVLGGDPIGPINNLAEFMAFEATITGEGQITTGPFAPGETILFSSPAGTTSTENDIIVGTGSNETFDGGAGNDSIDGGGGNDSIDGSGGNDTITGGIGDDTLAGGTGTDTADYSSDTMGVTVTSTSATGTGIGTDVLSGFENVLGGSGDDTITGDGVDNTLTGNNGKDTLFGGDGNDKLFGGNSNDTMVGGAGDDKLFGGAGTNTADYSDDTLGITVTTSSATGTGIGTDTLNKISKVLGGSGDDNITGGGAANVIYGNDGDDTFFGGGGNDKLFGGSGADTFFGGTGNDKMFGGAGRDTADYSDDTLGITATAKQVTGAGVGTDKLNKIENVTGGSGNDMITGGSAANILTGNAGDDTLNGGNGNDTLFGGTGADRINGGKANDQLFGGGADGAADVFIFGDGFGDDTIGDWEDGFDLIDFTTHSVINDISDLNIDQSSGVNTEITFGAHSITIEGFVGTIDANDFVF